MSISRFKDYLSEETKTATFTFGRFNPPTTGHLKLLDKLASVSKGNDYFAFMSHSQDAKKNPLSYSDKVKHARKLFPKHGRSIVATQNVKNAFDAAVHLYNKGYANIVMVVGSDRIREFDTILKKYNGVKARHGFYNFQNISVVSAGDRDPDADDVSGMSASKQRENARNNDFSLFSQGLPRNVSTKDARALFNDVRKGMGLKEEKKFKNHVDLEPVSDVREKYISGDLFEMGDQVIIKETDQLGVISWLGSNYVIVEFESGDTTRKWITDVEKVEGEKGVVENESPNQVSSTETPKRMSTSNPIYRAKQKIKREKQSDKRKHDRIIDRARIRAARLKNKEDNNDR